MLLLQISSCSHTNFHNFHKQKYLHGRLKPVYTEESQKYPGLIKSDSVQMIEESFPVENTESVCDRDEPDFTVDAQELPLAEAQTKTRKTSEKKTEVNKILPLPKEGSDGFPMKISQRSTSSGQSAAIVWIIILVILGLIALPFAFLIGFWAFIIATVLLTAALIIGVTTDPFVSGGGFLENLFGSLAMIIILITLIVLIAIALAIALVWFIIWGIIQLVN